MRDAGRTLRRYPGGAVVSVTLRGRTYVEVIDDMIDGVLRRAFQLALGNELPPPEIDLTALEAEPPTLTSEARVAERQTQAA